MSVSSRAMGLAGAITLTMACAVAPPCPPAELAPLSSEPTFAVVSSDYLVSAIALLDGRGRVITDAWIDSATRRPAFSVGLGGDVVLPTVQPRRNTLTYIDRLGRDVVTMIATPSGDLLGQITTNATEEGATGFRSNPQDVLAISETRAIVSRHDRNANPISGDLGNDLVEIDLTARSRVATGRVDLSALDAPGPNGPYFARPMRLVRTGAASRHLVAGLARLDAGFRAGPGAVAIVDLEARTARAFDLAPLRNCGEIAPGLEEGTVVVLCAGDTFTDDAGRHAAAGIAVLEVDVDGAARVVAIYRASEHPAAPAPSSGLVVIGPRRALVAAQLPLPEGDRLLDVDLASGAVEVVHRTAESFAIGQGARMGASGALVPDGTRGVLLLDVGARPARVTELVVVSACRRLPAREVRALSHP